MKIKVLDCTLRDGGFINDWNFGKYAINNIFSRLVKSGIEIIEVGMLNDKRDFDINRTICPNTESFNKIITVENNSNALVVGMIIMGECGIENVGPCSDTILDGMRIVFKKNDMEKGFEFAKAVKEKGYKIFIQPASVTDYSEEELAVMLEKFASLEPEAIYIVDTYGLIEKKELLEIFNNFKKNLPVDMTIGYHAHNNLNIASSNSIELIENRDRFNIFIDTSVFGMGKNAGNAHTELIADYINRNVEERYDLSQILEILDQEINKIRENFEWGYAFKHFISGTNRCHPTYVQKLLSKNTLSINQVNQILSQIDLANKTTYNETLLNKLYDEFISKSVVTEKEFESFKGEIKDREILVVCPGSSLMKEKESIEQFIKEKNPIVIGANVVTDIIDLDFAFYSNSKRYSQASYAQDKKKCKIVATSNIYNSLDNIDYTVNFTDIACSNKKIVTNAGVVLLKLLVKAGVKKVTIAGFDGYSIDNSSNYSDDFSEYKQELNRGQLNFLIMSELINVQNKMELEYLTYSIFDLSRNQ